MNPAPGTFPGLPRLLRATPAPKHPFQRHFGCQVGQQFGDLGYRATTQERPLRWRHRHHHAWVDLGHIIDQSVGRQLGYHLVAVDRPQVSLEDGQGVSGEDCRYRSGWAQLFRAGSHQLSDSGASQSLLLRVGTEYLSQCERDVLWAGTGGEERGRLTKCVLMTGRPVRLLAHGGRDGRGKSARSA
jgi:hypothetical protein